MIIKIVGWVWLLTGIVVLIMPGIFRWRIQRKSKKIVKKYLFALAMLPAALLFAIGFRWSGIIPKLIMIIGLIVLIKTVFMLRSKAAERIVDFLKKQPVMFFRLWALAQSLIGLAILRFF